jgi:integrase/recombinase XerD
MKCSSWLGEVTDLDIEAWQQRFTDYMRSQNWSETTIKSYLSEARYFLKYLCQERKLTTLHELRRADLEAYQLSLEHRLKSTGKPLARSGKSRKVATVKSFVKFLYRTQVLLTDPGVHITSPRPPAKLPPPLPSQEAIVGVIESPDSGTSLGIRDRAILELLYSSALRNSELRYLRVNDVDLGRLQVRITRGKGSHQRLVPLGEPAAVWVGRYLEEARGFFLREKEHGFLFSTIRGEQLKVNTLICLVKKYGERGGCGPGLTPHVFRHCCATHMLENQVKFRHLQEFLGHKNPSSTQIYTRVEISDLREAHSIYHPRHLRT